MLEAEITGSRSSFLTLRWREMDSNFWFSTDVDLFCRPFLCRANSRDGWAYRGGAPPQDCLYTPTNSVENSLPSLSTTLAKGGLDVRSARYTDTPLACGGS
jgi:hypothetical protein